VPFRLLDPSIAAAAPVVTAGTPLTSVGETLLSLRSELLLQLSSRTDADATRINRWINWAYRNLAAMLKLSELKASMQLNLAVGQPFYLLPVQVRSIQAVSMADAIDYANKGIKLFLSNEDEYRRQSDRSGTPQNYFRFGRMLVVYPDPDTLFPIYLEFLIRPKDLVADTDSPILPQEFHESLLLYARHKAWRSLRNYQEASLAKNDFLTELRPLIDTDGEEAQQAPSGLTVARSANDLTRSRR
jgi:hypothetical protein